MSETSRISDTVRNHSRAPVVLVTGAHGFIGRHLCGFLGEHGYRVRALVRSSPKVRLQAHEIVVVNDLVHYAGLQDALRGVAAVVHLAACVHRPAACPDEEFAATNVRGTERLLEEAGRAGVDAGIVLSSVAAGMDTPYGRSKLAGERIAFASADRWGMKLVALRPPAVYGAGMKGNPLTLFQAVWSRVVIPVARPAVRRSMLYVGNLMEAIRVALAAPALPRVPYSIADADVLTVDDIVRTIARAWSRARWVLPCPQPLLQGARAMLDALPRSLPRPITSEQIGSLMEPLIVDVAPFSRAFGYREVTPARDALMHTARWFAQSQAGSAAGLRSGEASVRRADSAALKSELLDV